MNRPTVIPNTPHDPDGWFRIGQLIELAWEQERPTEFTATGVAALRDELLRRQAVVAACVDLCQGEPEDQRVRDLRALLIRLGYLEPNS